MNTVTVNFVPCSPTPANGYIVIWRLAGSVGGYTDAGNFTSSPAIFEDSINPDGSDYEGYITSDCSESGESNFGTPIAWTTVVSVTPGCTSYDVTNDHIDNAVMTYITCAGTTTPVFMTPGQTVTICAQTDQVFVDGEFTVVAGAAC